MFQTHMYLPCTYFTANQQNYYVWRCTNTTKRKETRQQKKPRYIFATILFIRVLKDVAKSLRTHKLTTLELESGAEYTLSWLLEKKNYCKVNFKKPGNLRSESAFKQLVRTVHIHSYIFSFKPYDHHHHVVLELRKPLQESEQNIFWWRCDASMCSA